jgi:hypothetical protein
VIKNRYLVRLWRSKFLLSKYSVANQSPELSQNAVDKGYSCEEATDIDAGVFLVYRWALYNVFFKSDGKSGCLNLKSGVLSLF